MVIGGDLGEGVGAVGFGVVDTGQGDDRAERDSDGSLLLVGQANAKDDEAGDDGESFEHGWVRLLDQIIHTVSTGCQQGGRGLVKSVARRDLFIPSAAQ